MSQTDTAPTPQQRFDQQYISSQEITKRLGVTRPAVTQARRRGILPEPIVVANTLIFIWERATVEPMVQAWEMILNAKRANKA